MSIELIAALMFGSMILLLLTGRHIFFVIGAVAAISAFTLWGTGGASMVYFSHWGVTRWYMLITLPLFILMGSIISKSRMAENLFEAIYKLAGGLPGGLGMGTIGLCSLIASMSGLNIAATVTAGTVALPPMLKRKYDKIMVTGIVQAGGALGFLIPPSIIFIVYGLIAKVSVIHLWVAGAIPGFLLAGMYIAYIAIRCRRNPKLGPPIPLEERRTITLRDKLISLRSGMVPLLLIFLVLGLLLMGVTSLIEIAAVGAMGALVIAAIYRELNWRVIKETMDSCFKTTTFIIWILMAALLFGSVFHGLGGEHVMERLLVIFGLENKWVILALMQLSFFAMGTCLDDTAMLLIVAPLYIPLAASLGFDLVWYGVLYVINCQMAYLTPPFGYNLFIMKGIVPKDSGITLTDIYKSVLPFVGIQALCLGIVIVFPQLALWLPNLILG